MMICDDSDDGDDDDENMNKIKRMRKKEILMPKKSRVSFFYDVIAINKY